MYIQVQQIIYVIYIVSPKLQQHQQSGNIKCFYWFVFKGYVVIFYSTMTGFPLEAYINKKSPMSETAILLPLNRRKIHFPIIIFYSYLCMGLYKTHFMVTN